MAALTPDQCRTARRELSLSQGDVAAATGLNRVYISDFENGGTNRLTTGQQRKLVDFFKGKQEEAQANGEEIDLTFGTTEDASGAALAKSDALRSTSIACLHFAISPDIPKPDLLKIIRQIENNEERLEELLGKDAKDAGLFGMGSQWDSETEADLQEAIGLMAANFVLSSLAQGKSFVYRDTDEGEGAKTVRDVMNDTFATAFTGVIANWVNTRPQSHDAGAAATQSEETAPQSEEEQSWL
jgi:transcriptional regulator with XRE-family HTH domain